MKLPKRPSALLYRLLIAMCPEAGGERLMSRLWSLVWHAVPWPETSTAISLHGRTAIMNVGNPYPVFVKRYPLYNKPLTEVVAACHEALGRPLVLVDVGSAVGDTILLVEESCPGMVSRYVAIDGDPEFLELARKNTTDLPVTFHLAILSSQPQSVAGLTRTHRGSSSAQGTSSVPAVTLDSLLHSSPGVDVLKIDTDGFDGRVLAGSMTTLEASRPVVAFEWAPASFTKTGNPNDEPFEVLAKLGYRDFLWFNKFGSFSHFSGPPEGATCAQFAAFCELNPDDAEWHYDVVAIPPGSALDILSIALLRHSRRRAARVPG